MIEYIPVNAACFDTVGETQGRDARRESSNRRVRPGPGKEGHLADDPFYLCSTVLGRYKRDISVLPLNLGDCFPHKCMII